MARAICKYAFGDTAGDMALAMVALEDAGIGWCKGMCKGLCKVMGSIRAADNKSLYL